MNDLTVVIATYTRRDMLLELLESLAAQTIPVDIIVSDDGTNPFSLQENLRGLARYIWATRDGGYHRVMRFNEGVMLAKTPYVVLLDDDCIPAGPEWSRWHLHALKTYDVVRGMFWDKGEAKLTPWFSSTNVSMGTQLARSIGPFDRNYDGRYGHEDLDLGKEIEMGQYRLGIGEPATAVIHRGTQRPEYHLGYEENVAYFRKKWNVA